MSATTWYWIAREGPGTLGILKASHPRVRELAIGRLGHTLITATRAPYFRDRLRQSGIDPGELATSDPDAVLRALAPVDKQALREAGNRALVGGRVGSGWFSSRSSGSTGEPFRTYFDPRAWAMLKYLVKLRSRRANGMKPHDKIALFDAFPPEQEGSTPLERLGRVRRISVFQTGAAMAERLSGFRPRAAYGLASALLETADALRAAGTSLEVPLLFTSGEVLVAGTRRALESAFGGRVLDIYGSTEAKEVAWECLAGGMHLNADVVQVEVLGPDGERVPAGVEGEIVITSLVNHAMPLIRFRVGDRGTLSDERCPCGVALPLFGLVTGREAEVLELGGQRLSPYVLTSALEQVAGLVRYQVRQLQPRHIEVRSVLASGVDPESASAEIRAAIGRAVPQPLRVEVEVVESLDHGPGRKARVVQPLTAARPGDAT